jgi:hypothetical protein
MLGAKAALAAAGGVVFIHGTGDQNGTFSCSGSGMSTHCTSPAYGGYWTSGEISSVTQGRPYAVVGFNGGTCAPWAPGTTTGLSAGSVSDPYYRATCPSNANNGVSQSNADAIAAQIQTFLTTSGVSEITIVTHSGGSNQARYILQNYTRNSNYTNIKNKTKRVVAIAGTTLGTYLANEAASGVITSFIANLAGYGGEGVNLLRTNYMSTYNGASSYFAGINNPVQGVNFYSTGGTSGSTCYGVKVFGVCIGITGPTLGGSGCASALDDAALLLLHTLYLNSNDSSTARNNCSDGFISCMGAQRLGNNFGFSQKQDHNQSRNQCNGVDVNVRNVVAGSAQGFVEAQWPASAVDPVQVDACGFSKYAPITSGSSTIGWTEGCAASNLGNGNCDWDCVALYGHDATPTWSGTPGHSVVTSWGATDDCGNASNPNNTSNTYGGTTYVDSTNNAWGDNNVYVNSSGSWYTQFNGDTCNSSSQCGGYSPNTQWFYDPWYGTTSATGYCPQSWIGDGYCDECVLAQYGSDGNDCSPGHVTSCGGIVAEAQVYQGSSYYYYQNAIYNEGDPTSNGSNWLYWTPISAAANDQICESGECTASTNPTFAGTSWCNSNSDCPTGSTCSNGGCTTAASDCSTTYTVPAVTCTENNNCNGDYCINGTCALTQGACSSDANCPGPSPATSTCSGGVCTCTTSSDCSNGAACSNPGGQNAAGTCATSVTQSLCR